MEHVGDFKTLHEMKDFKLSLKRKPVAMQFVHVQKICLATPVNTTAACEPL